MLNRLIAACGLANAHDAAGNTEDAARYRERAAAMHRRLKSK